MVTIRLSHTILDIEVFLLAGNDVIAIPPLGGAEGDLSLRILKERPRLHNSVYLVTIRLSHTISEILRFFC